MPRAFGLAEWWHGELELHARPLSAAAFLDALLAAGIRFRRARPAPDGLRLAIDSRDLRRLRPAARRHHARIRLCGRRGAPFLLAHVRRRPWLTGGCLTAALLFSWLSGYVWFVRIQGAERLAPAEILHAAAELGLRPGAWRRGLDPAAIAARLPLQLPQLSLAAVTLHGTLAVVSVAEVQRPAPSLRQAGVPGDVVAAHGGLVTGVSVSEGQALVVPGQEVQAGQVLIAGVTTMAATRTGGPLRELRVHAAGLVTARRWSAAYAEVPRAIEVAVPTGRVFVRRSLLFGRYRLDLQGWGRVPFHAYTLQRETELRLRWRTFALPVEFSTMRYAEVQRHVRHLSVADARDMAAAEARAFLVPHLAPHARIVQEEQRTFTLPGGRLGVELQVETEDNIGVFRPAAPEGSGP